MDRFWALLPDRSFFISEKMNLLKHAAAILAASLALLSCQSSKEAEIVIPAREAIERTVGPLKNVGFKYIEPVDGCDRYEIKAEKGKLCISGSSQSAICYAFNKYWRYSCHSMQTWGGENGKIPQTWPEYSESKTSPYRLRYFLNVCTFGYTTPFWDWERWSEELDWMIMHGFNMPLASVASEAIAKRVWIKLGLSPEEADAFFTGPAHLPWHRMGNLNSYDGPLSDEWHESQIELQHKILDRIHELGMEPVAPAFAGFVPPAFMEKHPEIKATLLHWGGFEDKYNACVLSPDSPYFQEIGKLFIQEWEKEFGKAKYWLSDSFNEMKLPVEPGDTEGKHRLLAEYGKAIWSSIQAGDPDAVWVTQGWTFGYQHDFWDPESLKALLSEVPDDRMIIIDLGNDYPKWVWHTDQTWRVQNAFHGKQWIYSYVPNFGGKVLPTGELQMYAEGASAVFEEGLADNLVGFGIAPEGIENNEVVYELLSDMAWTKEAIDLDEWISDYCLARYGYNGEEMIQAWDLLRKSVYSSLYSYPRFTWQTVVPDKRRISRHDINEDFEKALNLFLSCADKCSDSQLYKNDAVEFSALWLGELADRHYEKALQTGSREELDKTVELLYEVDSLLASHPNYSLSRWVDYARRCAPDLETADRYEANAKRLITTWGGWQEDYAARFWSGLIREYYIPRIQIFFSEDRDSLDEWEENWINGVDQTYAAKALIERVVGKRTAASFAVRIVPEQEDGKDWHSYYAEGQKIVLEGNNGVSVASALKQYLEEYCDWQRTWCGSSENLPDPLPLPEGKVKKVSPYKYRYYLNYCTFNYTMSWWDFERWQQEIDFMAMNGINMPLAVTGQNSVWKKVYKSLGFTDEELESFFSGPAYFNWFWMGNLDGWGGPLSDDLMKKHEELQKQILYAERSLGMHPVLPAFTGHVPPSFSEKFPQAKVKTTSWVNFAPVTILQPDEPMFNTIGKLFLEEQTALYGTDHLYTADTFNENLPPQNDADYLRGMSAQVYQAMKEVDPKAVWVMQGWLFHHKKAFWGLPQIEALLSGVPDEGMIILDLWSERSPVWNRTNSYFGKPWIWCMLHNFGQNITLSGNVSTVASEPARLLQDPEASNMVGIGLTMEGIEQNPAVYALMLENVWRDTPIDTDEFLKSYLGRRYGSLGPDDAALKAWQIIFRSAYENTVNNGGQESIITGRPNFAKNPGGTTNTNIHYDSADLIKAWDLLVDCARDVDSDGFRYDLVDVSRQVLANYASILQQSVAEAYKAGDVALFKKCSKAFLNLIDDMEKILATREEFLLGRWIGDARRFGDSPEDKDLCEKNARNLLTLWGNRDCRIRDYACRQWSGMMSGFYRPRWERFFDSVQAALEGGYEFDQKAFDEASKDWEWSWVNSHETYPEKPSGDSVKECLKVYRKYRSAMEQSYNITVEGEDKEMI